MVGAMGRSVGIDWGSMVGGGGDNIDGEDIKKGFDANKDANVRGVSGRPNCLTKAGGKSPVKGTPGILEGPVFILMGEKRGGGSLAGAGTPPPHIVGLLPTSPIRHSVSVVCCCCCCCFSLGFLGPLSSCTASVFMLTARHFLRRQ